MKILRMGKTHFYRRFIYSWLGRKKIKDRFGEIATEELRKKGKKINEINLGKYGAATRLEHHLFESFFVYNNDSTWKKEEFQLNNLKNFVLKAK